MNEPPAFDLAAPSGQPAWSAEDLAGVLKVFSAEELRSAGLVDMFLDDRRPPTVPKSESGVTYFSRSAVLFRSAEGSRALFHRLKEAEGKEEHWRARDPPDWQFVEAESFFFADDEAVVSVHVPPPDLVPPPWRVDTVVTMLFRVDRAWARASVGTFGMARADAVALVKDLAKTLEGQLRLQLSQGGSFRPAIAVSDDGSLKAAGYDKTPGSWEILYPSKPAAALGPGR
jgi:hypothetical protein